MDDSSYRPRKAMDRQGFSQLIRRVVATKSHPEVEDDETERLVRPMPKVKPPRRDRRRENVELDRDPDVEGDPDLKGDPDLSLNYKNIGGSVVRRFLARRFLADGERIPAKSRETGKVVLIAPDTLKKEPGKYEEVKHDDNAPSEPTEEAEPAKGKQKTPKEPAIEPAAANLLERVRGDESLLNRLRSLANPEQLGGVAKQNPNLKLEDLKDPGEEIAKATGAKTLGEAIKVFEESGGLAAIEKAFKGKLKAPKDKAPKEESAKSEATKDQAPALEKQPDKTPEAQPDKPVAPETTTPKTPKKKAPESDEEDPPAPPPTEAEKAGIPAPSRKAATPQDYEEAVGLIFDTFPKSVADQVLAKNLHPDDVRDLVASYVQAKQLPKPSDLEAFAKDAQSFYELDPDRVTPPKKWKQADGVVVDFKDLPKEEQASAYRKHQMQVVAFSHAIQETLTREFEMRSTLGVPRVPPYVASAISTAFLSRQPPEQAARDLFQTGVQKGGVAKLAPGVVKKLMASVPSEAQVVMTGFLQANDFNDAKSRFLDSGEISERDRPGAIFKNLKKAEAYLSDRAKAYSDETNGAARVFRDRVLSQLRTLDPDKYRKVRTLFDHEEADQYDAAVKVHKQALSAWKDRMMAWGKKQDPYRGGPFSEEPPEPPKEPARYALVRRSKERGAQASELLEEVLGRSKTASQVSRRFISFYSSGDAMDRKSVYHGIDPVQNYPGPYPGWNQTHPRDFGEADSMLILRAAREWLKQPVLATVVPGFERDVQMRAALDLGLKSSGYAGHVSPQLYEQLLAQLAGSEAPKGKLGREKPCKPYTLEISLGAPSVTKESKPMPTKLSAEDKKAADESLGLLDKVAATIETNFSKWGMTFEDAKRIVNQLDIVADDVEANVYGPASLQRRQIEVLKTAQVLQKDSDESYMDTFNKPTAVHQQDADEAYMSAYQDDQTAAVRGGR